MYFKVKIILIYGILLSIIKLSKSQESPGCNRLEEKLNLSDVQKDRYNLKDCGGIHDTEGPTNISGGRDNVKRYAITRVSWLLPNIINKP